MSGTVIENVAKGPYGEVQNQNRATICVPEFILPASNGQMVVPLLATKYYIPPAGKTLIIRPQLVEKLDACLHPGCRLALISAPAGFGKTTLITSWADRLRSANQEPTAMIAWLSLDEGDNDPVTFWSYVISALQTQTAGLGKHALGMLQSQQPAGPSLFMPSLVNDLAQISSPLALILDDYHLVRSPEIHRWLSYLIDHAPAQFHVDPRLAHRPSPAAGAAARTGAAAGNPPEGFALLHPGRRFLPECRDGAQFERAGGQSPQRQGRRLDRRAADGRHFTARSGRRAGSSAGGRIYRLFFGQQPLYLRLPD